MSFDRCSHCSKIVDTDDHPEVYREQYDDDCICTDCFESLIEDADEYLEDKLESMMREYDKGEI